jgi:acetylornithine/succinyldiaminopimelate/putrescine aminotransferase
MTVAKALASGVAAGVMMVRPEVAEILKPGMHASTYGGNPIACRAGLATIETIEADGLLHQAKVLEDKFRKVFEGVRAQRPDLVKDIRVSGVMVGVELTCDAAPVVAACLERKLLINATQGKVIRLLPALNLPDDLFEEGCAIMTEILLELDPPPASA